MVSKSQGPEKWQHTEDTAKEHSEKKILNPVLWVVSLLLGQQSTRSYNDAEGIESLINAYYISIGHYASEIVLTLIAIKLVKTIQNSQNKLTNKTITTNTFSRDL